MITFIRKLTVYSRSADLDFQFWFYIMILRFTINRR